MHSVYDDVGVVAAAVREGGHRELVGGMWEELGRLQIDFLRERGLKPSDRLLDIGAGALRLGVHAVRYLQAGHYFATDLNRDLLLTGWSLELDEAGREKLPLSQLSASASFDFTFLTGRVNYGIAQSVFTHLPASHLRQCLAAAAPYFDTGGRLYVTAFLCPGDHPLDRPLEHRDGVTSFPDRDPFHHSAGTMVSAAGPVWSASVIGEWGHPRGQSMIEYVRL